MTTKLHSRWEAFRFNFWFIPLVMIVLTLALAAFTLWLDQTIPADVLGELPWVYVGGPDRSLFLLSVIAGAMVTVAGLVFTVTVVALTLASSQYGHRLLRTYITDPGNQAVTGMFICTFIYALIILHSARNIDVLVPTPQVSITVAGILSLFSFALLIYYLHHASTSLQVEIFAARLGRNLIHEIERQFPNRPGASGDGARPEAELVRPYRHRLTVVARREGYLRFIDYRRLLRVAYRHDLLIRVPDEPGRFVVPGKALAEIHGRQPPPGRIVARVRRCFWLGPMRNLSQDIRYGVDQLVEVALRALSVNAPFTATGCVEWIGAALSILASREESDRYLYDKRGAVRVIRETADFEAVASSAFDQLRQYSYEVPGVSLRTLDVIGQVMVHARKPEYRHILLRHAQMIEQAKDALPQERDAEELTRRFRRVARLVGGPDRRGPFMDERAVGM